MKDLIEHLKGYHEHTDDFYDIEQHICPSDRAWCEQAIALVKAAEARGE